MPDSTIVADLVFDRCVIRRAARQVLIDGHPAKVGGRAFDLLLALIEHRDREVSKNELLAIVWPGLVVEENNLQVHISALRKLLGPETIATIPGRGYRFTAAMAPDGIPTVMSAVAPAAPDGERRRKGESSGAANCVATSAVSSATSLVATSLALAGAAEAPNSLDASAPPTLFGRDDDLMALTRLVATHRLVTITGAGGIGKTVLAQAVARSMQPAFPEGVWLVDLAPLTDGAQLAPAVASALQVTLGGGASPRALAEALRDRRIVIVLDNCEYLVQPVAHLAAELLRVAPGLHLLATSQEPLKLADEHVYRVGTLALPAGETLDDARESGAVRLFAHRAEAADAHFVLNEANVAAVVDICTQLDGIPLAIELAAARVQLLGVHGLRDRLGQRLFVLSGGSRNAPPRHRTLRAALEWSHTLLPPEQQAVFRRLGVMSGPFGLDASQQVAAEGEIDAWAVLDHLGALVEKSLVAVEQDEGGEMRYRMLETMRQYALERLAESGEQHATRERHLACFLALAEQAKAQLAGPRQGAWLKRLDLDRDNLLSAHAWCDHVENGAERGLRLVNALMRYWLNRGLLVQGHQACVQALARSRPGSERHERPLCPDDDRLRCGENDRLRCEGYDSLRCEGYDSLRCEGLLHAGSLCAYRSLDDEAETLLRESVSISRRDGFPALLANALSRLGFVRLSLQDRPGARACLEEALALARQLADGTGLVSQAATSLAELERIEGRLGAAEALYEEGLQYVRAGGDRLRTMIGLNNLAMVAVATGADARARAMLIESLAICDELGSRRGRLVVMEVCAGLAAHLEQWELAARFDGAADAHTVQMGRRRDVADAAFLAPFVERARGALGAAGYRQAQAAGRAMSYDDAVAAMMQWLHIGDA